MTNKIISNIVEKINELTTPENENEYCQWTIERVFEKINEIATPAEPQKQAIIDFFVAFKGNVERELEAPLDDSLLGITADNAYIAGLKTAINIADNTASDVIDRLKIEPQQSIFDADGWCWDLSLIDLNNNDEQYHLLYKNINRDFIGQYVGYAWQTCYDHEIIAWRPLPKLPTGGDND
jgi:hypothetical protein